MSGVIWQEFLHVLAAAWICFAMGAALWHWRSWATFAGLQHCSKLLLLLSPVLLSAFGYRSTQAVRSAELMAQAVPVRHVGHEIEPVIADRDTITTQQGVTVEFIRTNYGWGARSVRVGDIQTREDGGSGRSSTATTTRGIAGAVSLPLW